jgi:hypothetical protein
MSYLHSLKNNYFTRAKIAFILDDIFFADESLTTHIFESYIFGFPVVNENEYNQQHL